MPTKYPDEVFSTHVFHAGTTRQYHEFIARHRADIVRIDQATDRTIVTTVIRPDPTQEAQVFVSAVYPMDNL
jgi:hypothetical protein